MAFKSHQHKFSMAPQVNIQRSGFDRSFTHTTTFDAGYLIPFYVDEVLPGDTFKCNCNLFARMLTPTVPFMDNIYLDTHFFFVPYRLLWDHWVNMHGEQKSPGDSTDYTVPQVKFDSGHPSTIGSIADYFGIPPCSAPFSVSALPFRAYNRIWNEWFRDENLQDSVFDSTADTDISFSSYYYKLLRRGKRHDYFTSALPWPQKGPGVELPIGDYAPVKYEQSDPTELTYSGHTYNSIQATGLYNGKQVRMATGGEPYEQFLSVQGGTTMTPIPAHTMAALYADLRNATATTINDLRQAFQLQRLMEAKARGGTRYTELLQSIYGVTNPDARLQRSEYLGGGSTRLSVYSVPQTGSTDSTSPQGNLAAYATASDSRHAFTKSFTEFGIIIGLVSVRADLHYQQGLNRMWSRKTQYDFYYPQLAHLGEQAILNKEIYLQGGTVGSAGYEADEGVFGYQERWAEYRYQPSLITGKLRSTDPQSLDVWHLAQKFDNLPTLSADFIQENPPIARVVAVQNEPQFKLDSLVSLQCYRPMPMYSVPGLIDHF